MSVIRYAVLLGTGLLLSTSAFFQAAAADEPDPRRPPAITTQEVPAVPDEVFQRQRQYSNVRSASFSGWAPDGTGILISTRFGNASQLHRVYEPGGRREQITFFEEPVRGGFIPRAEDNALLLSMSSGGNENYQVHYLDPASFRTVRLTDGSSRNRVDLVRPDGKMMIVASTQRNGRDTDLYLADPRQTGSMQMLLQTDREYWGAADWSQDGKTVLIQRFVSINESYLALLDVSTGKTTELALPREKAAIGGLAFAPDAKSVYLTTDALGEFRRLARLDLETKEYHWLTDDIDWDVNSVIVEPESGLVAFAVNADGASDLYILHGDRRRKLPIPLGIVSSLEFSPDGEHLGFSLSRPDAPTDAYSLELASRELTRWTVSEVGGLNAETFVTPTRFQYKSFDGRMIPAYYFKPRSTSADRPTAVLINIHGGPESQYRPYFSSSTQYYVNELGLAVISPNVRGSAGYGKTYVRLDNAELRENSVKDIGALLDWIDEQPELDSKRIAVAGGSYGGYMVLASLEHFGERIRAGVDIVGIANFITFLENTADYRRDLRRAEYGDERDPQMRAVFERINPTANADKIRSALLVAHGKNDPRVPFSEAEQIANRVRELGRSVWTVYADNEGHGFRKKDNADYVRAVQSLFLQRQLGL